MGVIELSADDRLGIIVADRGARSGLILEQRNQQISDLGRAAVKRLL